MQYDAVRDQKREMISEMLVWDMVRKDFTEEVGTTYSVFILIVCHQRSRDYEIFHVTGAFPFCFQ